MTHDREPSESDRAAPTRASVIQAIADAFPTPPVGLVLVELLIADAQELTPDPSSAYRAIMARLTGETKPTDVVIETGPDGLAIVRAGLTAPAEAEGLAYRLHAALSAPLHRGDDRVVCQAAIGVAVWRNGDTAADLLRYADHALGDAYRLGGDTVVAFDDQDRDLLQP